MGLFKKTPLEQWTQEFTYRPGESIAPGTTITQLIITVTDSQNQDVTQDMFGGIVTINGSKAYYVIKGGEIGKEYQIKLIAYGSDGGIYQDDLTVVVVAKHSL